MRVPVAVMQPRWCRYGVRTKARELPGWMRRVRGRQRGAGPGRSSTRACSGKNPPPDPTKRYGTDRVVGLLCVPPRRPPVGDEVPKESTEHERPREAASGAPTAPAHTHHAAHKGKVSLRAQVVLRARRDVSDETRQRACSGRLPAGRATPPLHHTREQSSACRGKRAGASARRRPADARLVLDYGTRG